MLIARCRSPKADHFYQTLYDEVFHETLIVYIVGKADSMGLGNYMLPIVSHLCVSFTVTMLTDNSAMNFGFCK